MQTRSFVELIIGNSDSVKSRYLRIPANFVPPYIRGIDVLPLNNKLIYRQGDSVTITTPSFYDYKLDNMIFPGSGSGQLNSNTVTFNTLTTDENDKTYRTISRVFTNNSDGNITIREMSLYLNGHSTHPPNVPDVRLCVLRELTGDIELEPEQITQMNLEISIQS